MSRALPPSGVYGVPAVAVLWVAVGTAVVTAVPAGAAMFARDPSRRLYVAAAVMAALGVALLPDDLGRAYAAALIPEPRCSPRRVVDHQAGAIGDEVGPPIRTDTGALGAAAGLAPDSGAGLAPELAAVIAPNRPALRRWPASRPVPNPLPRPPHRANVRPAGRQVPRRRPGRAPTSSARGARPGSPPGRSDVELRGGADLRCRADCGPHSRSHGCRPGAARLPGESERQKKRPGLLSVVSATPTIDSSPARAGGSIRAL